MRPMGLMHPMRPVRLWRLVRRGVVCRGAAEDDADPAPPGRPEPSRTPERTCLFQAPAERERGR
jgi:hypothetical protein